MRLIFATRVTGQKIYKAENFRSMIEQKVCNYRPGSQINVFYSLHCGVRELLVSVLLCYSPSNSVHVALCVLACTVHGVYVYNDER